MAGAISADTTTLSTRFQFPHPAPSFKPLSRTSMGAFVLPPSLAALTTSVSSPAPFPFAMARRPHHPSFPPSFPSPLPRLLARSPPDSHCTSHSKSCSQLCSTSNFLSTPVSLLVPVLVLHALTSAAAAAPTADSLPVEPSLDAFHVLLTCAGAMLAASAAKMFNLVSTAHHSRVDRVVAIVSGCSVAFFFLTRLADASAAGHISLFRFAQFFMAGGICAFVTHAACTPIDVVKTRIQTTQGRYVGMFDAFQKIVAEEGVSTLLKGLGATASGYFLHGAFKYSFYEVFKLLFSPDAASAIKPPLPVAAISGLFAECIACVLLCPMEAIRIRSVADASFPSSVITGLSHLLKLEGLHGLYKGLPAMLLKQVPYTVGQFVSFEFAVIIVKHVVEAALGAQDRSTAVAYISSFAGLLAGITAAIISHPGDTILSKINQEESEGSAWAQIVRVARAAGFFGLFLGLGPRLLQVSCMIGGQFLIYDSIKLWCGIVPASALSSEATKAVTNAALDAVKKLR